MAQAVKNLPAMRETWVQFLGWEDPLEEGMATPSSKISMILLPSVFLVVSDSLQPYGLQPARLLRP